jgi:hypothetical protein
LGPLIVRVSTGNEVVEEHAFFGLGSLSNTGTIDAVSIIDTRFIKEENFVEQKCSTARSLLKFAGTWAGDDFDKCLREVYATRSKAKL